MTGGFPPSVSSVEDFAIAEINKLSVGQALDKLRRPDVQSKQTRHDEKMDALDEGVQRMSKKRPYLILAVLAVVSSVLLVLIILYATLVQ